ncbi:MAG: PKD domain-containing protein [Methanomicrobiales archaeon]|nr:PKD domain-containing protein [Methanomicrobiales archaeon]
MKYTSDGTVVTSWRLKGTSSQNILVGGISVAPDGNVFVTHPENHSVQKYSPQGVLLTQMGSQGSQAGQFYYPTSCTVDNAGNVYVMDAGNYRIQKFAPVTSLNHPPLLEPLEPQEISLGSTYHLTLKGYDPDGDTLGYSYGLMPGLISIEGASLDRTSGVFTWKPTSAQMGFWNIQFEVSDGEARDVESVTIHVTGWNHVPRIGDELKDTWVILGDTLQFSIHATDEDGDSLEYFFSPYLEGATLDRSTGAFSWKPEGVLPGNYLVEFNVFDSMAVSSRKTVITVLPEQPPITPRPLKPDPVTIGFELIPERNVMDAGGTNVVTIRPLDSLQPQPFEVTILVDGVPERILVYHTEDLIYAFTIQSPGIHTIAAEANVNGQRISGMRYITVRSNISPALDLAHLREEKADAEIEQALRLVAVRNVQYHTEAPRQAFDLVFKYVRVASLANTPKPDQAFITKKLDAWKATDTAFVAQYSYLMRAHVALWPEGPAVSDQMSALEKGYDILSTRRTIDEQEGALASHIVMNPHQYRNSIDLRHLFFRYTLPLTRVVEEYGLGGTALGPWNIPLSSTEEAYERARYASDLGGIEADLIESIGMGSVAVTLHSTPAFELINGIMAYLVPLFTYAMAVQGGMTFVLKGLLIATLNMGVPVVSDQVEHLHRVGAQAIMDSVQGGSIKEPATVRATDTRVSTPTRVTSSGYSLVVTPYGSVVDIIPRNGEFIPEMAGEYSLVTYRHDGQLFSDVARITVTATRPNVTVDISPILDGNRLEVTMEVRNHETDPVDHAGLLFVLKNATEGLEYRQGEEFDLAGGASRVFSSEVTLPRNGTYTGTVTLTYRTRSILRQTSFLVNIGEKEDDVAIVGIEILDTYPPSEPITIPVTLDSAYSATVFDLVVPELEIRETVNLNGRENFALHVPAMQPGRHHLTLSAEKNGRTLDLRSIELVVTADGVGFLVLQPETDYLAAPEPVPVTLSLKDLVMNGVDAHADVVITDPDGRKTTESLTLAGGTGQFLLTPAKEGTYQLDGSASKQGWAMADSSTVVVVGNMSRLAMEVSALNEAIIVQVTTRGRPVSCAVTCSSGNDVVTRSAPEGIAIFNKTESFTLEAEKPYFEHAFFQYGVPGNDPGILASFTANVTEGEVPLAVQFTDTSLGYPDTWSWQFGDSAVSGDRNPFHVFNEPGDYTVTMVVRNAAGSRSHTMTIRVVPADKPGPASDTLPPEVTIKAPSPGIIWYGNQRRQILWKATDDTGVTGIDIEYSLNNGTTWSSIATSQKNTGRYIWTVVNADGKKSLIRITARDDAGNTRTVQAPFIVRRERT